MSSLHIPVLKNEVLEIFSSLNEGVLIDCTLGFGGHTKALLEAHSKLQIVGIDQDRHARNFCKTYLPKDRVKILKGNFADRIQEALRFSPVVGVLADIGVSSLQLDDPNRGFSFHSPCLDMRMNQNQTLQASHILNTYSKIELERIFRDYGEIKEYKKMASLLIQQRQKKPFESALELSVFLEKHFTRHKIHPATLAFQALRIEVNQELKVLQRLLFALQDVKNATLAIISFHSLEDKIIKTTFKEWEKSCICPQNLMRCECGNCHSRGRILTKKPLSASLEEIKNNPRSRSAKLRAFQFGS